MYLKQNTNLMIKLLLLIILVLLLIIIRYDSMLRDTNTEQPAVINLVKPTIESLTVKDTEQPAEVTTIKHKAKQYKVKEEEYFYATRVYKYFRKRGFTKEAAAGIIGNMMIETSGGSLDLKPNIYSKSRNYYGLCQWSKKYYPEAHGLSFKQQLKYLLETMPWEFKTFGWLYKDGFSLKDFKKMTNVEEAALAFTKVYERCTPASYELRKQAAIKAYNYFKALK